MVLVLFFAGIFVALLFSNDVVAEEEVRGIVSFNFDDGVKSQYNIAFFEMKKYGYNGTLFMIANKTGFFEGRELMTFDDARDMQDAGWEIGSHGLKHVGLTILSSDEIKSELKLSKEILEKEGLDVKSMAFPYGAYNDSITREAKNYYSATRPMQFGFNSVKDPDFYNLKSKWVLNEHSSEEICSWIQEADEKGLWLILSFHKIEDDKSSWSFSEQKFKEVLECANSESIDVKTIKEVLEK